MSTDSATGPLASPKGSFRWRSWLGVAVVLFLLYGAANFFFAIQVPVMLHSNGISRAQIVSNEADSAVLGKDITTLAQTDPALSDYLVAFMDTMCMMMMAFAISQLGIAWFALRRGQTWALWTLAIADISFIPYLTGWTTVFSNYGLTVGDSITSFGGFWIFLPIAVAVATGLGWFGLRKGTTQAAA
ncbi:MAG: hypothetical protein HY533_04050 [Chloroflexi bacterium]|nr:hypothetical protein [Chloroflexota bacterium]